VNEGKGGIRKEGGFAPFLKILPPLLSRRGGNGGEVNESSWYVVLMT
jgi:hypothetical protein